MGTTMAGTADHRGPARLTDPWAAVVRGLSHCCHHTGNLRRGRRVTRKIRIYCAGCGLDVYRERQHPYMLIDTVWLEANDGSDDGHLCISCVEARLGRRLAPDDFNDAVCNTPEYIVRYGMAPILLTRVSSSDSRPGSDK